MKYLKRFNESKDKLFRKLTHDIGKDIDHRTWMPLSDKEVRLISDKYKRIQSTPYLHGNIKNKLISNILRKETSFFMIDGDKSIEINKDDDEWYLITIYFSYIDNDEYSYSPSYYICDQFDGLESCLSYILEIDDDN